MVRTRIFRALVCVTIITIGCTHAEKNKPKIENENSTKNDTQEWAVLMIEGYRNFNKNRSIKGADQIFEATELMPRKNLENYLVSAMAYASKGENEKAFKAIGRAIEEGFKDSDLLNSIPEFSPLHNDVKWESLLLKADNLRLEHQKSIQNPKLLEELKNMWAQDQAALNQYEESIRSLDSTATDNDYRRLFESVEDRWEINKNKLDSIVKIHGWPGNKLVGEDGAKIAWAIPQHYPNVFFKEKCLGFIKEAMKKGDVDPNYYAELKDRIARETWQKQTFGASMAKNAPYPIENPAEVNKRRLELGLFEPVEVYAIYHGIEYKLPTQEEIQSLYEKALNNYKKFENFIGEKKVDSANTYIVKAIKAHGDISNEQLYEASIQLAQINNRRSQRISMNILKVLIWRKWEKRYKILEQEEFNKLRSQNEWKEIKELIKMSR